MTSAAPRRSRKAASGLAVAIAVALAAGLTWGEGTGKVPAAGQALYRVHCGVCHGPEGRGDGEAAFLLSPKPRDLTRGLFKIRSTPSGSPPSDDDLLATLARGLPGSSMPSFAFLGEADRRALIDYVKSLSPVFQPRRPEGSVRVPFAPLRTSAAIAAGRALYEKHMCATCHGAEGRGDGPLAGVLRDDWGSPIAARDLTSGVLKGGAAERDLYLRLATGMSGTPMNPFGDDLLAPAERWQLVYYLQSLRRAAAAVPPGVEPRDGAIVSAPAHGPLPASDPTAAAWSQAPAYRIPLNLLWSRATPPPALTVRSLNDGRAIAFLLEWADAEANTRFTATDDFRDAAAIQLVSARGRPDAPLAMGDRLTEVNIWHWKADWQIGVERGRAGRATPVEDGNAVGFGTLTPQPPGQQNVAGKGLWKDGRWRVVFSRALAPGAGRDADLSPAAGIPIAFAVWDGGQGDRNGQKAVSAWYRLSVSDR